MKDVMQVGMLTLHTHNWRLRCPQRSGAINDFTRYTRVTWRWTGVRRKRRSWWLWEAKCRRIFTPTTLLLTTTLLLNTLPTTDLRSNRLSPTRYLTRSHTPTRNLTRSHSSRPL